MRQLIPALSLILTVLAAGCVSSKRYSELESRYAKAIQERDSLDALSRNLTGSLADATTELDVLNKSHSQLKNDTLTLGKEIRMLRKRNNDLAEMNKTLEDNYRKLLSGSEVETAKILAELRDSQSKLQTAEDQLHKLQGQLDEKTRRLDELEKALAEKEKYVKEIREKVMEALKGFKDSGLTVEIKNGKVYVSMSEKLLFASGSTEVDQKGREALTQLAKVLEKETELNIMIEGHTDNVPLRGTGCMKDNWDLSVARATAIVKILLNGGKIDPSRLTAAGRGEFAPVAANDSPDNRSRNRRTEIILTPKLDKLFDILN